MAHITSGQIVLGKCASFLGITQGIAWFIMALLCVVEYNVDELPEYGKTYMEHFNYRVFNFYLYKDANLPDGTIVTPTVFTVFMILYIVLNTVWIITSAFQITVLKKLSMNIPIIFKDWAIITWIISGIDLIFILLLSCDYNLNCLDAFGDEICINTIIPIVVIAARGFTLWIINVFIAWRLLVNANLLRQGNSYQGTFGGIVPISRPVGRIPRAIVSTPNLYGEQHNVINNDKLFWNVNLRTAMENRTPPVSPTSPSDNNRFFTRY